MENANHETQDKVMRKPKTTLERRAAAACAQIQEWGSCDFSVEWVKSSTWGFCPRVVWRGEKVAHASGCGYDKLSAVLAEFLTWLVADSATDLGHGCGLGTVQDRLAKCGWRLEHTYNGAREDGFRLTRLPQPSTT